MPTGSTMSGFVSDNPGRDVQRVGTARSLAQPVELIHGAPWGVVGTTGDSQCYLGVRTKVDAMHTALSRRIDAEGLAVRLVAPTFTTAVSDGQLNGTRRMRYSLVSREVVHDGIELHLRATDLAAAVAVVACDKPPVGTLAAILEHNAPAVMYPDGSIRPGVDPETNRRLDLVSAFQHASDPDPDVRRRVALHACPGQGSCSGMFTYNTMQTFIAVAGMTPLHMVSPASDDIRRVDAFPDEIAACLDRLTRHRLRPRDIVTPASLRNALLVTMAMGGSTNVVLHAAELARAAGFDLWRDVMTQDEFNDVSRRLPVLVDMRPFGAWSMVDLDAVGGIPVVVRELLGAGWLDGSTITCTTETLAEQIARLDPPPPDGVVAHRLDAPYTMTGGLRLLHGNLAPGGGAVLKVAGIERGIDADGRFVGRARVFDGEASLIAALRAQPHSFDDGDMVVIRHEGPRGAPGMPEMLDPTSRITTLCRERNITVGLMTDARFSGGSVGLVVGHVAPEAHLGGPIALIHDGDTIVIDLDENRLDCVQLDDALVRDARQQLWNAARSGGADQTDERTESRLLRRMRATARPALEGAGMD